MPQKKVRVIVTRRLPDVIETRMMELFDCRLNLEDRPMSQAQLIEAVKGAEVLVPTVTDRIDSAVLSQAGPQLKLIASFRSEEHTSELKSLMRISYAVFCLKKKKAKIQHKSN